jgi:deoxyribodipyrimidine photo-lyase
MKKFSFIPTRAAGLERLKTFLPSAGNNYAALRNYDLGQNNHTNVSLLSPYIRHRSLTEIEVLKSVLCYHSKKSSEKFVQEVFWRTYWKGWLEMRPTVWAAYQSKLNRLGDDLKTQSGFRKSWENACQGETGIECFDSWAKELFDTGYLHNHARMWFASIWIHTLKLPWELGADFFLRNLLDGDPASNTLGWRWVGGAQTVGKTYLASTQNIQKYTKDRFSPTNLSPTPTMISGSENPERKPISFDHVPCKSNNYAVLLHSEDMDWSVLKEFFPNAVKIFCLLPNNDPKPLISSNLQHNFKKTLLKDSLDRWEDKLGLVSVIENLNALENDAFDVIYTNYIPIGHTRDLVESYKFKNTKIIKIANSFDRKAWPFATHGFFRFKEQIDSLLTQLDE